MECCTNKKFKRLTWGLASLCQAPRPPRLRALTRGGDLSESPGVVRVGLGVWGWTFPRARPCPALSQARRSPRFARSTAPGKPGLDRAPQCPAPGCLGLGAGRPRGGLTPWERGLRDPGRWRRPGGGGGQRGGEEGEAAEEESSGSRRLPTSAARPGPARMRVTSAPSARPPRDAGPPSDENRRQTAL